ERLEASRLFSPVEDAAAVRNILQGARHQTVVTFGPSLELLLALRGYHVIVVNADLQVEEEIGNRFQDAVDAVHYNDGHIAFVRVDPNLETPKLRHYLQAVGPVRLVIDLDGQSPPDLTASILDPQGALYINAQPTGRQPKDYVKAMRARRFTVKAPKKIPAPHGIPGLWFQCVSVVPRTTALILIGAALSGLLYRYGHSRPTSGALLRAA
ncbi:MAG TPA: hypothetical protein VMU17_05720, partial [Elusimicrobiota bacterium]|nr:hypothetical protein [Elusimicrobiota bacterium]